MNKFIKTLAIAGVCVAGMAGLAGCSLSDEQLSQIDSAATKVENVTQTVESIETKNNAISEKVDSLDTKTASLESEQESINARLQEISEQLNNKDEGVTYSKDDILDMLIEANSNFQQGGYARFAYTMDNGTSLLFINEKDTKVLANAVHTITDEDPDLDVELTQDDGKYDYNMNFVMGPLLLKSKLMEKNKSLQKQELLLV